MIRYLLIPYLFIFQACFSQQPATRCWECIVAAKNLDNQTVLNICKNARTTLKEEEEIVSFVLGKLELNEKNYDKAIKYLEQTLAANDTLLKALTNGLIGDCYLEKKDYPMALRYFQSACQWSEDTNFEIYFLHKQGICYSLLDRPEDHKKISSLLKVKGRETTFPFEHLYFENSSGYDSISRSMVKKLKKEPYGVGIYRGKQVSEAEFFSYYNELLNYRESSTWGELSDAEKNWLYEEAWELVIGDEIRRRHREGFVLTVGPDELIAYLAGERGYESLPWIQESFADENGIFRKELLLERISEIERSVEREERQVWEDTQSAIKGMIESEKLDFLISQGIHVSDFELNSYAASQEEEVVLELAHLIFEEDRLSVKVDENKLKEYYEQHKYSSDYLYDASRHLQVIMIPVSPDAEDSLLLIQEMTALKTAFITAESDSVFVETHSETVNYGYWNYFPASHSAGGGFTYPDELHAVIRKAKAGEVVGPYQEDNMLCIAKVGEDKSPLITARHILIQSNAHEEPEERAEKRKQAERILKKINRTNFTSFVQEYSNDSGSIPNGGIYENFFPEQMVSSFANYCASEKVGKIGLIESEYGFHIIEVLKRSKENYPKLLVVRKKIAVNASKIEQEKQHYHSLAQQMNNDFQNLSFEEKLDLIKQTGVKNNYDIQMIRLKDDYPKLPLSSVLINLEDELLRFAYTQSPFTTGEVLYDGEQFVIPILTGVYSGEPDYEQVYRQLKYRYQTSFLLDSIHERVRNNTDLERIAEELGTEAVTEILTLVENSRKTNPYYFSPGLLNEIFKHKEDPNTVFIYKDDYSLIAYRIIEKIQTKDSEITDIGKYLTDAWTALLTQKYGSHNGTTIYNYPLYKLGVRK